MNMRESRVPMPVLYLCLESYGPNPLHSYTPSAIIREQHPYGLNGYVCTALLPVEVYID